MVHPKIKVDIFPLGCRAIYPSRCCVSCPVLEMSAVDIVELGCTCLAVRFWCELSL